MNEPLNLSPTLSADNAAPRLAPSTLGEILDRTVQLYRSNFLLYLGISLVPTAVVIIPACGVVLFLAWLGSLGGGLATPGRRWNHGDYLCSPSSDCWQRPFCWQSSR